MAIGLEEYQLILLRTPKDAPHYDDETTGRIQRDHLAFYASMREAGRLEVQAMSYLCRPGTMVRSGIPVTVDD